MSKPQLVVQDFGGEHNRDLSKTRARLTMGGSWRQQRIVEIMPSADMVPAKCVLSWRNLFWPPNQGIYRMLALGQEVGEAYSAAIEQILAHPELSKWEYILTMEHDNAPPQDGVIKLIEHMEKHPELSCIGGLYFTKGEGGVAQIWGDPNDKTPNSRPQLPDPNGGIVECQGTGMGFNLWRIAMFRDKRLERPWFRTLNGKGGQGIGTQDLVFWKDARKYGYRCAIACDVRVGHYDATTDMMW